MATATASSDAGRGKGKADPTRGGLLRPYKPGQGFWTRLGTAIGAGLVIIFTIQFFYRRLPIWTQYNDVAAGVGADEVLAIADDNRITRVEDAADEAVVSLGVVRERAQEGVDGLYEVAYAGTHLSAGEWPLYAVLAGLALALGLLAWWLINRARHAEFLIETDNEMKKVKWPGRRELVGSTKVVVAFMFFMAFMLFAYDMVFSTIAYFMNVLKIPPFFL